MVEGESEGQRRIAAPFDAVWRVIAHLERTLPLYERDVTQVRVTERHGEFLRLLVQQASGDEDTMDARLRPGWCLMQSATVVAFAARPEGGHTLLAHLEHRRTKSPTPDRPAPPQAALPKIDQELQTIEHLARTQG